jgi:hypothetical protein
MPSAARGDSVGDAAHGVPQPPNISGDPGIGIRIPPGRDAEGGVPYALPTKLSQLPHIFPSKIFSQAIDRE